MAVLTRLCLTTDLDLFPGTCFHLGALPVNAETAVDNVNLDHDPSSN